MLSEIRLQHFPNPKKCFSVGHVYKIPDREYDFLTGMNSPCFLSWFCIFLGPI